MVPAQQSFTLREKFAFVKLDENTMFYAAFGSDFYFSSNTGSIQSPSSSGREAICQLTSGGGLAEYGDSGPLPGCSSAFFILTDETRQGDQFFSGQCGSRSAYSLVDGSVAHWRLYTSAS